MPRKNTNNNATKKKSVKNGKNSKTKTQNNVVAAETDPNETKKARKEILEIISQDNIDNNTVKEPKSQPKKEVVSESPKESPIEPPQESAKAKVETKAKPQIGVGRKIGLAALAVVLVFVVAIGVFAVGLYGYGWDDEMITQRVVKVIPFPAAIVQNSPVTYSQFFNDLSALEQYYQKQYELNPDAVTIPSKEELQSVIMDKLIQDKLLLKQLREAGLKVTQNDIDEELANVIAESGGEETLAKSLNELYGWTIDDFTDSILRIYLAREKMQGYLSFNESLSFNQEAKERIEEVADKLKNGELDFKEAAAQYSEDVTASNGGSLGFLAKDELEDNFAQVAFSLEEGETSDVVHTLYGYHIIKVEEVIMGVDSEGEADADGEERRNLSHILIKTKDLDEWLNELLNNSKVYNFVQ